MAVEDLAQVLNRSLAGGLAGGEVRLEALQPSLAILPRFRLPDGVWPDLKPEEVEARGARWDSEGMGDPGFTGLQFQSHRLQPS